MRIFNRMPRIWIACIFAGSGTSCHLDDYNNRNHITKFSTKANYSSNRTIFVDDLPKIDTNLTEQDKKEVNRFSNQKLPMIKTNSISPMALADLMEKRFQQSGAPRISFLIADADEIDELKVPRDFEDYRKRMGAFFPDKKGEYDPYFLLQSILPNYSFFWIGKTLIISRFVGAD